MKKVDVIVTAFGFIVIIAFVIMVATDRPAWGDDSNDLEAYVIAEEICQDVRQLRIAAEVMLDAGDNLQRAEVASPEERVKEMEEFGKKLELFQKMIYKK